ncbi:amidase [Paenibacillus sp. OV219]|uniref:amidase n=1 Tax=Paenibacillus sp. OV219 TaxID=1884377 RepID=UPI0008AE5C47|nr:amidase [Paenibacillus sp. OV219]SEO76607.1 amidase [Paenibacillus sp. OV219]
MKDVHRAFIDASVKAEPTGDGVLDGMTFAVKDVFHVRGHANAAGNPDWLRTHPSAERHAAVIERLLAAGATLTGVTHTDELMYSLNGENVHYGTPVNPADPERIPGGSSSGSAVAVAGGYVRFAIGTDTGGSVRVPASYCGIYGFRPTHDAVSLEGVIPLAPSFDTVGWFARDAQTLRAVGQALLLREPERVSGADIAPSSPFRRLIFAQDAWELVQRETTDAWAATLARLEAEFGNRTSEIIAPEGLAEWMTNFRVLQGLEIRRAHGAWIEDVQPLFAPDIAGRMEWTRHLRLEEEAPARRQREERRARLAELLGDDAILVVPTAPGAAPRIGEEYEVLERYRYRLLQLTAISGLAGLPQLTIPGANASGLPIGLSFIAPAGFDRELLNWAVQLDEKRGNSYDTGHAV